MCSVDRRRLPPDRQTQENNYSPKGRNHLEPGPGSLWFLWGREALSAGLGAHGGGGGGGCGVVGVEGSQRRRPQVFNLGGHDSII